MNDTHIIIKDTVFNQCVHHFWDSIITIQVNIASPKIADNGQLLGLSPDIARILIPVLVTILIFFLGIVVNFFLKKYERKSSLKSTKSVLLIWCKLIYTSIKQQSNGCRDFNNRLQKSLDMQPERFQFNVILTNKIQSLELRELIDTLILNQRGDHDEKSKCLYNLTSQIEFLDLYKSELRSKYETYHKDALMLMDQWNDAYRRLNSIYTDLRINLQTNPTATAYPFYRELATIFNSFVKGHPSGGNINKFKNELFSPIVELCQRYALSIPSLQETYIVSLAVQDLLIIIKKWDTNREGTGQLFNDFANRIEIAYKVLQESISKIEKMKFKWIIIIN